MKPRHVAGARQNAQAVLAAINAAIGQDFHTLTTSQIELVLEEADRVRYQRPRNANGSRARYFYQLLQRQAQRQEAEGDRP